MIYRDLCFAVAFLLNAMPTSSAELSEELLESSPLPFLAVPASWSPSECELSVSSHKVGGEAALCMHVPVDYHAGEKQYPIGWPRMTYGFGFWQSGYRCLIPWIYQYSSGDPWNNLDGATAVLW